jgi:hypothetical protein
LSRLRLHPSSSVASGVSHTYIWALEALNDTKFAVSLLYNEIDIVFSTLHREIDERPNSTSPAIDNSTPRITLSDSFSEEKEITPQINSPSVTANPLNSDSRSGQLESNDLPSRVRDQEAVAVCRSLFNQQEGALLYCFNLQLLVSFIKQGGTSESPLAIVAKQFNPFSEDVLDRSAFLRVSFIQTLTHLLNACGKPDFEYRQLADIARIALRDSNFRVRVSAIDLSVTILNSVTTTTSSHDDLFFTLLRLLHDTEDLVRNNARNSLLTLSLSHRISLRHTSAIPKEILRSSSTNFETLRDQVELLAVASGACASSYFPYQDTPSAKTPGVISTLMYSSISANSYRSNYFTATMTLLSQRQEMGPGSGWFNRFFVDSNIPQVLSSHTKEPYPWKDVNVATFWALWEAARHCVNTKLRTTFGGPAQTFEGIEKMLQYNIQQSQTGGKLASFRQLIQFVDYLERHIYNAYEGCLNLPSNNQKPATTFFKANRKVCEDWFARMRQSLVISSISSFSPADTIRHSLQRVLDLQAVANRGGSNPKLKTEIETTFRNLCVALLEMKECDTLEGVLHWSRSVFRGSPRAVPWLSGVIAQSKGQFEQAIKEYSSVLESDALTSFDQPSVRFTVNQAVECCYILSDWDAFNEVLNVLAFAQNKPDNTLLTLTPTHYDLGYLRALSKFDNGSEDEAKLLVDTSSFTGVAKIEAEILKWMISSNRKDDVLLSCLQQLEDHLQSLGSDDFAAPYLTQLHCLWLLMHSSSPTARQQIEHPQFSTNNCSGRDLRSMLQIFRVIRHLRQPTMGDGESFGHLLLPLAKTARKQANHRLTQRFLTKAGSSPLAQFERAKLDISQDNILGASSRMLKLLVEAETVLPSHRALTSSVYKTLGECLEGLDTQLVSPEHLVELLTTARGLSFFNTSYESKLLLTTGKVSDIAGMCYRIATQVDPKSAKGWSAFADWCFRVSKELMHSSPDSTSNQQARKLTTEVLLRNMEEGVAESIGPLCDSLSHLALNENEFEEQSEEENAAGEHSDVVVRRRLMTKEVSRRYPQATKEVLDEVVTIWLNLRQQALSFYSEAARSYFKFLRLQTESISLGNITATLRLLHLLVNFSDELSDVLATGFRGTTTTCWQDIIPQMFAHLGHPDQEVRQQVKILLSRLGKIHPHLVVYSVVVGCETSPAGSKQQKLFQQIISELHADFPLLVDETSLMIGEFKRITMFWEEQWLILLNHLHVDVHSRIRTAKDEVGRVSESDSLNPEEKARLIRERYSVIMKPVIMRLEHLHRETSSPSTPHECWFFNTYGTAICRALVSIRNPSDILSNLPAVWQHFHDLSKELAKLHLKPVTIKLRDISPLLAQISSSKISLPGVHPDYSGDIVTIQSFEPLVAIIPTKTRPKKITILGSDGREYAYLIKGREDLHLDERIMQLLNITNQVLKKDRQTSTRKLRARHYAVIPLSERSGLIQWVDGAVPLFSVYKHWQRRSAAAKSASTAGPNPPSAPQPQPPVVTRPSDMFYGKIIPALKEKGISNVASRKDWPVDVLKRVFLELVGETPNSLLSKELWISSSNTLEWWQKTKGYVRSTAVMSIIGYLLGLGDRHLDNILIDFSTGEVVHIDYNICFEKGLHLRIPETVPFRLTQNMIHALGPTGVEGTFRIGCEQTMRVLRGSKEVLLTLLEAFVYDPLVDWAVDRTDNEVRKNLEVNVSLSLFASRIEEMKAALEENKERLANAFLEMIQPIEELIAVETTWGQLVTSSVEITHRRNTLKLTLGESSVENTTDDSNEEAQHLAAQSSEIISTLTSSLREAKTRQENIKYSLSTLLSSTELISLPDLGVPSVLGQSIPIFLGLPAQVALSHGVVDPFLKRLREGEASMTNVIETQRNLYNQLVQHLLTYRDTVAAKGVDPSSNICQAWISQLEQLIETSPNSSNLENITKGQEWLLLQEKNLNQETSNFDTLAADLQSFREASERLSVEECERRYSTLQTEITQKLTAVHSTDPTIVRSWQESVTLRSKSLSSLRLKVRKALQLASGILDFERLRSSTEQKRSFAKYCMSLLDKLKGVIERQPNLDLQLVKLKLKDLQEDGNQLASELKKTEGEIVKIRHEIENCKTCSKERREIVKRLRGPANEAAEKDTQVMSEIMSLLVTTVKITERLESVRDIHRAAKNLHLVHSTFTSRLAKMIKDLSFLESLTSTDTASLLPLPSEMDLPAKSHELQRLISGTEKIHANLLQISQLSSAHTSNSWQEAPGSQQSDDSSSSSASPETDVPEGGENLRNLTSASTSATTAGKKPPSKTNAAGPGGGGATTTTTTRRQGMQQNVHAVEVVKRVESKLEGLDHLTEKKEREKETTNSTTMTIRTPPQPESIRNQVDRVLQQATSADNLCMLYEGWTAWI